MIGGMTQVAVDRRAVGLLIGAVLTAAAVSLAWALLPSVAWETGSASSDGTVMVESGTSTLVESEGPSVLFVLALPVVPAAVALAVRRRRLTLVAAWLTAAFCFLGMLSVGLFYVPTAALLFLASRQNRA